MGLTFIAAGVSVPDAIASLLVVRDGKQKFFLSGNRLKLLQESTRSRHI